MTRNIFWVFTILSLFARISFATVDSPVVQGQAGANRAGVAREAIFANPASITSVKSAFAFFHYSMPKIPDFNAGGRAFNVGMYDGGDQDWKGGISYSRTARASLLGSKRQGYIDTNEIRFSTAHSLFGGIDGGITGHWNQSGNSQHYFEADLGILFPLFADMRGGVTWENVLNHDDDNPSTIGVGANYLLGYGFTAMADGYRLMSGSKKEKTGWALALEAALAGDFYARGGIFQEGYSELHGWSLGLSWLGPRASFDYAMKTKGDGPKERIHMFGITMAL